MRISEQEYAESYRQQVIFVTTKIRNVIDDILAKSQGPVIIVLQADHGPSMRQLSPSDPKAIYRERMSILGAFYLPDRQYDLLCPSVTPVNIFRIISNRYLGANLERLEDRNYFSTYAFPYTLVDVTDQVAK